MQILEVTGDKKRYMELLLLADEQESMIDRYLEQGTMYLIDDGGTKAQCVVTDEGNGVLEIKSLSTQPRYQRMGYATKLINFIISRYSKSFSVLQVGTGDGTSTVSFYEKCGFARSHIVKNFFTDNYDHQIYEDGVRLTDMIYLRRRL